MQDFQVILLLMTFCQASRFPENTGEREAGNRLAVYSIIYR
jgi:hypothetical protein